jgi:hypothetical protein
VGDGKAADSAAGTARRRRVVPLVAVLIAGALFAISFGPNPSWLSPTSVGYSPRILLGLALLVGAGVVGARPRLTGIGRLLAPMLWIGFLGSAGFALAIYDESFYRLFFHQETPSGWALTSAQVVAALARACFTCLFFSILLLPLLVWHWLFPHFLRALDLEAWWNRETYTEVTFTPDADVAAAIAHWARLNRAEMVENPDGSTECRPHIGRDGAPVVRIYTAGSDVRVLAGVAVPAIHLLSMGFVPRIAPAASGGFGAMQLRTEARQAINGFLLEVGGPAIS